MQMSGQVMIERLAMNKSGASTKVACKFVQILREAAHLVEVGSNRHIYYG